MTTTQSIPSRALAYANAPAWLPADTLITPARRSSALRASSRVKTPRGLKEPVRWKSSAFRKTGAPAIRPSVADDSVGVR